MIKNYIIFQISKNKAMIDIENIQEIVVKPDDITPILDSDIYVEGLINLRGEAIPVIDLRLFLNVEKFNENETDTDIIILILKHGTKRLGIIVDAIYHVSEVNVEDDDTSKDNENNLYNVYFPKIVKIEDELVNVFKPQLVFENVNL